MKLCLECYKEKYKSESSGMYLISVEKEKCDNCGENKYIVIKENFGYLLFS